VTLFADRVNITVPGAQPYEMAQIHQIAGHVHDGFKKAFPEVEPGRVQADSYSHLDLGSVEVVNEFLGRFLIPSNETSLANPPIRIRPSVKYTVMAEGAEWQCEVQVDQSELSLSAIFTTLRLNFLKMPSELSFLEKAALIQAANARCLRMIDLEQADAAQE
jgi:hypothetical protein